MSSSAQAVPMIKERTIKVEIERLNRDVDSVYLDQFLYLSSEPYFPYRSEPSLNLLPQFQGTRVPSFSFCISTTGFRIPGTAADASRAVHMTVSGAVR